MISITRGDDRLLRGQLTDPATKLPLDLTGFIIWFTVKRRWLDGDSLAIIRKSTDPAIGGISVPDVSNGTFFITITNANTASLEAKSLIELLYDIQVKNALGMIQTVHKGKFYVEGETTQAL